MTPPDTPSGWTQALLLPWLDDPQRDERQLLRWLEGYGYGDALVDPNEEPYVRLLRELPPGADLPKYERELARSAVGLLDSKPDLQLDAEDPDKVLYNLFRLCGHLRCATILAEPLRALFRRNSLEGRRYLDIDLRHQIRFALIHNQPDSSLETVWMDMAAGRPVRGLPGVRLDGFEGIKCMQDPKGTGAPPWKAIAMVLTELAGYLSKSVDKVEQFAHLLLEIRERFPIHFDPPAFIVMSDEQHWPEWTDLAIPELFLQTGPGRYIVWEPIYEFVKDLENVQKLNSFCDGRVIEVRVRAIAKTLKRAARVVEEFRYRAESRETALMTAWSALAANQWDDWPKGASEVVWRLLLRIREDLVLVFPFELASAA